MGDDDKTYRREVILITQLDPGTPVLYNFKFYDCHILGPAVLGFDGTVFDNNTILGEPEAILWKLPKWRHTFIGGIGLVDCVFDHCVFEGIGFAGGNEFINDLRRRMDSADA
ncbi:MAG: hypothetical protein JWM76_3372 [Pseudonocardiales bacterium]|jgi:hypothetical protein|nr:hypothetical protein [Pseudonocardiales bacterium]